MLRHDAEAARRFPGPDYREILSMLHRTLRPRVYVEIGVLHGDTLRLAAAGTAAIGVDPEPRIELALPAGTQLHTMTSDEFFRQRVLTGPVDLAFIDGLHLYDQALRDLHGLASHLAPGGVAVLHDTMPLNEETATRERRTEFHTGDVWKSMVHLSTHWPHLRWITVPAAPTGLTLVRGFDGPLEEHPPAGGLDWAYYQDHHRAFLHLVPNTPAAIQDFLQ